MGLVAHRFFVCSFFAAPYHSVCLHLSCHHSVLLAFIASTTRVTAVLKSLSRIIVASPGDISLLRQSLEFFCKELCFFPPTCLLAKQHLSRSSSWIQRRGPQSGRALRRYRPSSSPRRRPWQVLRQGRQSLQAPRPAVTARASARTGCGVHSAFICLLTRATRHLRHLVATLLYVWVHLSCGRIQIHGHNWLHLSRSRRKCQARQCCLQVLDHGHACRMEWIQQQCGHTDPA